LFQRKEKKQFIPLPWKIVEFVLKNVNKSDNFTAHFSISNLRYVEDIRGGFQPLGTRDVALPLTVTSIDSSPAPTEAHKAT
jgi:hypothetical protein